jgi:hypothetical protein
MDSIKREYPRMSKKIKAMINIHLDDANLGTLSLKTKNENIKLLAETKDISWGGFCLQLSKLPKDRDNRFTPEKAHTIIGKPIVVNLNKPHLTLWGDVVRFDSKGKQMAIIITKVSDYELWQELCKKQESI